MGGLALIVTLLILSMVMGFKLPLTPIELCAVFTMGALGLVDDLMDMRARWKASLGLVMAVVLAVGALQHIDPNLAPYQILGIKVPPLSWLAFILLVLLFWCIPQAINLIDGANGLATGFGLVVLGSLWVGGTPHPVMCGALLACLVLNWPKARLFLGDCGSLSIGLLLVLYAQKVALLPNPNRMLWLFAYPIIDVSTVIAIRLISHKPVFLGDRNHLHYQLGDRWPAFRHLSVPLLLGVAAMCGSETYLAAHWVALPYVGLTILLAMSGFFILTSIRALQAEGAEASAPDPLPADPGPQHLPRQRPALEGRVEALALHKVPVDVNLRVQVNEREVAG